MSEQPLPFEFADALVPPSPAPIVVTPQADSRLAQLHAAYPAAKAAADEAAARLKEITDGIKFELSQNYGDAATHRYDLAAGAGPALRMTYTERWTLDSKKLKADDPLTYVRYAKKGGSWSLKAAPADGGEG